MMKLDTIHHIAIIGSDYEKSKNFYVEILGFEVIRENYREERKDYKIDLRQGNVELELFIIPGRPKRPSYPEANGLRHLAFKVEDVEKTAKELQALGVETEPIRTDEFTGEKMTFFFDPDGQPLELHG
nr:VOC family protein [Blautia argi]